MLKGEKDNFKKMTALNVIKHNDQTYQPGDTFDIEAEYAESLKKSNSAKYVGKSKNDD